jgi:hypothetical protein
MSDSRCREKILDDKGRPADGMRHQFPRDPESVRRPASVIARPPRSFDHCYRIGDQAPTGAHSLRCGGRGLSRKAVQGDGIDRFVSSPNRGRADMRPSERRKASNGEKIRIPYDPEHPTPDNPCCCLGWHSSDCCRHLWGPLSEQLLVSVLWALVHLINEQIGP